MPHLEQVNSPTEPCVWSMAVPPSTDGPSQARHALAAMLQQWDLRCLTNDAALVADELVGNVWRHGAFPAELTATWSRRGLRLEVSDLAAAMPALREPDHHGGYGLRIVDHLAKDWGVIPLPRGKVVWATLPID
jgi:hypothetical protein